MAVGPKHVSSVLGLESGMDVESGLKRFGGIVLILLINTIVLAIGLCVPKKSYTNTSMSQGRGNWPPAGMAGHRQGRLIWRQSAWSFLRFSVLLVVVR